MATFIRLTNYKLSEEKDKQFFNPNNKYVVKKQDDFSKIPGSPIAYWASDKIKLLFEKEKFEKHIEIVEGIHSRFNDYFLRLWFEVGFEKTSLHNQNKGKKWFPINKGGNFRKWYGNNDFVVNWENDGVELRNYEKSSVGNCSNYFNEGITYTEITSSTNSFRYSPRGFLYDITGPTFYLINKNWDIFVIMGYCNSKIVYNMSKILNPTIHLQIGNIKNLSIRDDISEEKKSNIRSLTQQNINTSQEEWDSRETSWDFTTNELLHHKTTTQIEAAYNNYCIYWKDQFFKLHTNEEELNHIFIDIYDLTDDLTPNVPLEDITILKDESEIKDSELVFKKETLVKQFISYAVGCMFGRYSPEKPGLILANQGETIKDFREKVLDASFMPDDDNIIPILDDDYFIDDIVGRFKEFLKATFGAEALSENLDFIAGALSKSKKSNASPEKVIRDYFLKDFFKDHVKMYKKRPIYWLFTSGKGRGFNALVYMHRYNRETLAKMRTDYLLELEAKLDARIGMLGDGAGVEKGRLEKQVAELVAYDEKLNHKSLLLIEIEIDDGVKVNYAKFEGLVEKI